MAVNRIWFPNAPVNLISASDRVQIGIGYGGIVISPPTPDMWVKQYLASGTWLGQQAGSGTYKSQQAASGTWVKQI